MLEGGEEGGGWVVGRISNRLFLQMNSESAPLTDFSRMLQAFGLRVIVIDSDFAAGGSGNG